LTFFGGLHSFARMDTMKVLLGATIALLIGALAFSFQGMKQGVRDAPPDEIARLQQQVAAMQAQTERERLERELQEFRASAQPQPPPQPVQTAVPDESFEQLRAELAAKEAALAELEAEKEKAERDATVYREEAGAIGQAMLEKGDDDLRRSRLIKNAMTMGRVLQYTEAPDVGDFVVVEILVPENIQPGNVLAIRRNTGILGHLKIADVTPEGAIANVMPGFGPIKPQEGDELIIPPRY
jgi:hypothetical protein